MSNTELNDSIDLELRIIGGATVGLFIAFVIIKSLYKIWKEIQRDEILILQPQQPELSFYDRSFLEASQNRNFFSSNSMLSLNSDENSFESGRAGGVIFSEDAFSENVEAESALLAERPSLNLAKESISCFSCSSSSLFPASETESIGSASSSCSNFHIL